MFISFEGIDGSGKTTHAGLLSETLTNLKTGHLLIREPGGTAASEHIRELLLNRHLPISSKTEILLYAAARSQLLEEVIAPALLAGRLIICDRYIDSSLAYQGYGLGGDLDWIRDLNQRIAEGIWPELTFLLDLPVEEAVTRRSGKTDRIEQRDMDFYQKVRRGYLTLAAREPERFVTVNALWPLEKVRKTIWEQFRKRYPDLVGE